jgi:biopolymer transport protein ExbD
MRRYVPEESPLVEINMVPMIDIMLVLLVIFIVTAPLLTHGIDVDLPHAASRPLAGQKQHSELEITVTGNLYWNGKQVTQTQFADALTTQALENPEAELRIRADRFTPYEQVAKAMAIASRQGVSRIGFISLPEE